MLEKNDERDKVIGTVCEDFSIWGPMFRVSSDDVGKWESFKSDMYLYAKDNLMRINMYIRDPSVAWLVRDEKTSWIGFLSNIGGLMGLCMGFSVVSFCELIYYCFLGVQAFLIHNIVKK